jgi:hypothetical protein
MYLSVAISTDISCTSSGVLEAKYFNNYDSDD